MWVDLQRSVGRAFGFAAGVQHGPMPHKWSFCFFIDLFFPIAGRAQYFLQPDFQWVWAGSGDHQEGHHCDGPGAVLRQSQAAGRAAGHRGAGPEQPSPQVRRPPPPPSHFPVGTWLRQNLLSLFFFTGTVWLVWWWPRVIFAPLPNYGPSHDSQPMTFMLSFGLR